MDIVTISKGQMCQHANCGFSYVGVVFFDSFKPVEGLPYLAAFVQGLAQVAVSPVERSVPEGHDTATVNCLLRKKIWPITTVALTGIVRFIPVFREQNGYVMYGASPHPILPNPQSHSWYRINGGEYSEYQPECPNDVVGLQSGQLLTQLCVWECLNGVPHTIPNGTTRCKEAYYRLNALRIKLARGSLTNVEYIEAMAGDPVVYELGRGQVDIDYCRCLAQLDAAGEFGPDRPRTAAEAKRLKIAMNRACKSLTD